MKKIKIDLNNINPKEIDLIVNFLNKGKVVVLPTDTVYGLHADATNRNAIKKIYKIKQRNGNMPFLALAKSWCMVKDYAYLNAKQDKYMRKFWPSLKNKNPKSGPVTAILKSRQNLPKEILGEDEKIAIRLPNNKFLVDVIKKLNKPIVSTSLNVSGGEQIENLEDVEKVFKAKPDLVVDAGKLRNKKLSKLIDVSDIDDIKVIRG